MNDHQQMGKLGKWGKQGSPRENSQARPLPKAAYTTGWWWGGVVLCVFRKVAAFFSGSPQVWGSTWSQGHTVAEYLLLHSPRVGGGLTLIPPPRGLGGSYTCVLGVYGN